MRLSIPFFFLCLFTEFPLQAQKVFTSGAARNVMMGTDLSSTVKLDTLLNAEHLFALGPIHDLQGEITVFDGVPYTSRSNSGTISTTIDSAVRAPFLVYAYVQNWISVDVETSISSMEGLANLIDSVARVYGYAKDAVFPFRLHANWDKADFHIIMRDSLETEHSHERHDKAKQKFTDHNTSADLVGFYSMHHEGVFTHRGEFIHVHFLRSDRSATGHLDLLNHRGNVTIFLPEE
jgi:acetolactate decarboxylase